MRSPTSHALFIPLIFLLASCGGRESSHSSGASQHSIQIKGSDTMVNLVQAWAERYMADHPDVLVAVTGGGSGTGFAALLSGTCDIAIASREIKAKEVEEAKKKNIDPKEMTVALDGIAVTVSPKNPVSRLTIDQVADIFTGKIRNWKEIGGEDRPIVLLSRELNSGTHLYFKEHVLRKGDAKGTEEFDEGSLLMPSSQAIADEIAQNPNAIGYFGIGYSNPTQKILPIARDAQSEYYLPTIENIQKGKYYISRPLLMYINGESQGLVKDMIEFIKSEEGQQIVKEIDFVPVL
ncbi:MAG: PstS family phosphate ABC transporter substrate-binding protein [Candidatus Omnitrophota bacterium]|nr:PstS family phosphate ABC transporter substrate-binding protein [Candidatus Omnitrophota bacterium]MDZ4242787.1 PstS family phosphate ABC transporter substrate-binding protein [Candidatus Omnitrophota bacterium]